MAGRTRPAFLVVVAVSCAQVLDLGEFEPQAAASASAASGGSEGAASHGGAGGSGASGGQSCADALPASCGVAPLPRVLACPVGCDCSQSGVCKMTCDEASNDCSGDTIECPPGFECDVLCMDNACQSAIIECPKDYKCTVTCDTEGACPDLKVNCDNGPCFLRCLNSAFSCNRVELACGCNRCSAFCEFQDLPDYLPTLTSCGQSCDCMPCAR